MATSGESLAITIGIYLVVVLLVFFLFSRWRTLPLTKRFFAPKRYMVGEGHNRPPTVRKGFGWVKQIWGMSEAEVIRCAGIDAAVYLKILRMGLELFLVVSFIVCVIIIPINATGSEVDKLMANPDSTGLASNPLVFWWPPPPPPLPPGEKPPPESDQPSDNILQAPEMFDDAGPAPPGMTWWKYKPTVPPLPTPEEFLGKNYSAYGWRWDADYQEVKYTFTDLDKTTISNISAGSARLWAHAIITWVVTLIAYHFLWRYNKEALRLRIFYLLNQPAGAESHTVLCQDVPGVLWGTIFNRADGTLLKLIPKSLKEKAKKQAAMLAEKSKSTVSKTVGKAVDAAASTTKSADIEADNAAAAAALSSGGLEINAATGRWEMRDAWAEAAAEIKSNDGDVSAMVEATFQRVYRDSLLAVHMCHDTSKLDPLVQQYENVRTSLTDLVDNYISLKRRGKKIKIKKVTVVGLSMGEWGKEKYGMKPVKVDALEFYRDRLTELRRAIQEEQAKAGAHDSVYPAAFVTFRTRNSQVVASRTLMSEDLSAWRCQAAPRAEEVVWKNVGFRIWERSGRNIAMWAAFVAMAAFFMIPVTAVQGLLSMNSFLGFLNDIPIAGALVTGILPGLALKIFLIIVPIILKIMNTFAGMVSSSQIDLGVVSRYFAFQVITVFLGSFIAGTFANQLDQFINDPGSIITIFGTSAPQTAIFFMTYLLLEALPGCALTLMRIVPLIIYWIKSAFLAGTERAKARLWQNQTQDYGTVVPDDSIAILLGLVFCVVCPLIAPIAAIFFLMRLTVAKYQLVYVFVPSYQSGGKVWTSVFDQAMVGLLFFHILMMGILGIKENIGGPILVLILLPIDVMFWVAAHKRFWPPQECLSLISAGDIDNREAALTGEALAAARALDEQVKERYLSPSFKFDEAEFMQVIDEANRMSAVLEGGEDEALLRDASGALNYVDDEEDAGPQGVEKGKLTSSQAESNPVAAMEAGEREGSFTSAKSARGGGGPASSLGRSSYVSAASAGDGASDAGAHV